MVGYSSAEIVATLEDIAAAFPALLPPNKTTADWFVRGLKLALSPTPEYVQVDGPVMVGVTRI